MAAINCSSASEPWAMWLADDALSFEAQALTRALQMPLSGDDSSSVTEPLAAASDPGRPARPIPGPRSGKIGKRKSRAKKRTTTTYINADPENFRAMVQQMTGARFADFVDGPVIKPKPKRQSFLLPATGSLDSSDFLLDRAGLGSVGLGLGPAEEAEEEELGFDVASFMSFPTLESWGMA